MLVFSVTCWAEEKGLWFLQVLEHLVGDGHLCVSEGGEGLFISSAHFSLYVIKKQGEGPTSKLTHLPEHATDTLTSSDQRQMCSQQTYKQIHYDKS